MKFELKSLLLTGDVIIAALAFFLASTLRFGPSAENLQILIRPELRVLIFVVVVIVVSYIFDVYRLVRQLDIRDTLKKISISTVISFCVLSVIIFMVPDWIIGRGILVISLVLFLLMQFVWHTVFRLIFDMPYMAQKIVIICTGEVACRIAELIRSVDGINHSLVGFIACDECLDSASCLSEGRILGGVDQLLEIINAYSITKIIVTTPQHLHNDFIQNILLNSKLLGIEIVSALTYYETTTEKLMLEAMDMRDLIYSEGFKCSSKIIAIKRIMDIAISGVGIIITAPFLPLIVGLVKLNSPGAIFYRQTRVGYMGEHFELYKFRTMSEDAEYESGAVWSPHNDTRLRPIGRIMRKLRLDEIPQLYNVFIGEMSFVGPRPERPIFVEKLQESIPFYLKRHFMKPGITGWAQIKFCYGASVEDSYEKLRYDLYYLKNMSPVLDTVIFLKTIKVVSAQFGGR